MQQAFLFLHHSQIGCCCFKYHLGFFLLSSRLARCVGYVIIFLFFDKEFNIFLAWSQSNNSTTDLPNGSHLIHFHFFLCNYNRFAPLSKFLTYDISYLNKIVYIYVLVCVLIYISLSQISYIKQIYKISKIKSFNDIFLQDRR